MSYILQGQSSTYSEKAIELGRPNQMLSHHNDFDQNLIETTFHFAASSGPLRTFVDFLDVCGALSLVMM